MFKVVVDFSSIESIIGSLYIANTLLLYIEWHVRQKLRIDSNLSVTEALRF